MTITLDATPRIVRSNEAKRLRASGRIPAIVYGTLAQPVAVSVDMHAFRSAFTEAGESTVVELIVDGTRIPTFVHALTHSTLGNHFEHIDFLAIDMSHAVQVDVPIVFIGVAPAERVGVVTKVLHDIHVSGLPSSLPHEIVVNLSSLVDLASNIRIKDLASIEGVTFGHDLDDVIVAVTEQVEDEPEAVVEAQEEPELAKGKKKEISEVAV